MLRKRDWALDTYEAHKHLEQKWAISNCSRSCCYLAHGRQHETWPMLWEAADDVSHLQHALSISNGRSTKFHDHTDLHRVFTAVSVHKSTSMSFTIDVVMAPAEGSCPRLHHCIAQAVKCQQKVSELNSTCKTAHYSRSASVEPSTAHKQWLENSSACEEAGCVLY